MSSETGGDGRDGNDGVATPLHDGRRDDAARMSGAPDGGDLALELLGGGLRELRLPLNAILGWVSVVRSGGPLGDAADHAVATIERHALSQGRLLDDIDRMRRIVSGEERLDRRTLDLGQLVASSVGDVRATADAKNVTIRQTVEPASVLVRGDAVCLRQIVGFLVGRVIAGTPRGGMVRVSVRSDGAQVEVDLRHTTPSDAARASDPLLLDGTPHHTHGYLGPRIVRHLIGLHGGGVVCLGGTPGQPTTFSLALVTTPSPGSADPLRPSAEGGTAAERLPFDGTAPPLPDGDG